MERLENTSPIHPGVSPQAVKHEKQAWPKAQILSPETVAEALRQPDESENAYNPDEIRNAIQNAKLDTHSLEDLFRAGRKLIQTEGKLRELGDLTGLNELKTLQIAYESKVADLYKHTLQGYGKLIHNDIPKFASSLDEKPNWALRMFQPRSTQIAQANKLINKLLDFQEIFNKLASCKDIGLSVDGQERIYEGELGIIPDIHENIQMILKQTSDDIQRVLTEFHSAPSQIAASHGGISNWGNGCYGISVLQALGATQHFAALNSQANADDVVLQQAKSIHTQVESGKSVSSQDSYEFFQTVFHEGQYNPNARKGGANLVDSLAQHDAEDFSGYMLDRYGYHVSYYYTQDSSQKTQVDTIIRTPLPRQSEPISLPALVGKRTYDKGIEEEKIFTSAPPLLPIQLIRFEFGTTARKITTPVELSLEEPLHVKVKENDRIVEHPYRLKSFISHVGNTIDGGHFITYRRQGNGWICCNDGSISPASTEQVKAASLQAYTLFLEPSG